ncbi:hypothetical protein E1B28_010357 [Marasmius oreades]|uniref:Uncharacterized protein n=1 Tax=Marasmius oreades TaxID=181124 RepID=A0A9P7RXM9_9AGAR|nr:uncharacterized protein E1B28_010357 [Marasmius oreades]KAG7091312.1 hypothetical protein E1B28_010357 [Marasmius oreades]
MGFPTTMSQIAASYFGAKHSKSGGKLASDSSFTSGRVTRSRFTATSHLAHLVSFPAALTVSGEDSPRHSCSPHPVASSSREITRQDPVDVTSTTSSRPPLHREHVTYHTNNLDLFDGRTNHPLFAETAPTLSNVFPQMNDPQSQRKIEGYQYTGGWTLRADGTHTYIPTGNIREIPDEEDEDGFQPVEVLDDSLLASPRMLPPDTTPPPRPQGGICLLPPSNIFTPYQSAPPSSHGVFQPPRPSLPFSDASNSVWRSLPQFSPAQSAAKLEEGPPPASPFDIPDVPSSNPYGFAEFLEKEPIVRQNLGSIKRLCDNFTFLAPSRDDQGVCTLLVDTLKRVKESLYRGLLVPNDLWKFLSDPKRIRFRNRMLSLRRTLIRLERVSTQLTFLRSEQLVDILSKLGDHHKKLSDIASKLNTTFELLDLYGLHETALASKRKSSADLYLKARGSYLCKKPSRPYRS